MGQARLLIGSPKAQAEESYGPRPNNVEYRIVLRYRQGPLSPRQTQSPTEERGKNGIGLTLKENLKYPGKAALIAIQCSVPDRAAFFGFYKHPQQLWIWADGTSINLGKFNPTRGRRTANTGQYKRENK